MNNIQNTYNQQPQGEQMPPMPPMNGVQGTVYGAQRQRRTNAAANAIFPQWLSRNALITYFLALMVVSVLYATHSLPWYYMLSGVVAMMVFFLYGSTVVKATSTIRMPRTKRFERRIFITALIPRVIFVITLYTIFQTNYGDAFGFENADALYYHDLGEFVATLYAKGNFHFHDEIVKWGAADEISDMGYGVYVGFVYWLTGNSILAVRLLKCILSSITVLLIYRLAKRNFGEQTARMAAIFCALWPNFWYYCCVHLKETEMVFLSVLYIDQAEQMLRSKKITVWKVIPVLLIAAVMFTFRTVLGLVALLAIVFSVVISSSKVVTWGKRIIVGALAIGLIFIVAGNEIEEQSHDLLEQVQSGQQKGNMEWRGERENGNTFAKYAGASVFAPMIFTLPFPTMVRPFEGQETQQLLNGGNFVKNIISAFTIFAMVMLLMTGQWREHLLPLSFMSGYLVVLTMSAFAQSERFHQPVMPFELMFAAYGLSIAITKKKCKRWFIYWCVLMFIACIAWNWFKMAGRGL